MSIRLVFFISISALAYGCGGGGSSNTTEQTTSTPVPPPITPSTPTGCSVVLTEGPFEKVWPGLEWQTRSPQSQGLCPDELDEAVDYAFNSVNDTGAVLIIRNGYIVREQYASDRDRDSLMTSWSVAKSFASMILGAAIDDGYLPNLQLKAADQLQEWEDSPKAEITLEHLMTLKTALEVLDGGVFYGALDQRKAGIDRRLVGTPGEQHYTYSNSDIMLATEVLAEAVGMRPDDYMAQRTSATIGFSGEWWEDTEGHVMTYCCLDSTARKFARFGLLYARGGEWNGTRVVSENWYETSTASALDFEYGFYWWPLAGVGFGAFGLHGQVIAIYPDWDLVVLRFSRYARIGDGTTVKHPSNYHATTEPRSWDNGDFLDMVWEALPD